MSILSGFDANEYEPNSGSDVIPAGWYTAEITASEEKDNRAKNGRYLELEFTILAPSHANRKVWVRLNLENPNDTAVDIARRDLSAICRAVGVLRPRMPEELHGRPLGIKVTVKPAKGDYAESNEVKGYAPVGEDAPKVAAAANGGRSAPARKVVDDDLPF